MSLDSVLIKSSNAFFDALKCQNQGRPPVWLMRQAGRYMPEYQVLRKKHSLLELFHTPELIVEVTKLPMDLLGVDVAIVFSDILLILEAFGCKVNYDNGIHIEGEMGEFDPTHLEYVLEGIRELKKQINVPLIGFVGGPYTVMSYYKKPGDMQKLTEATRIYMQQQVDAGVDALQVFDSWAGMLPPKEFKTKALPYLKPLVLETPTILFTRNSSTYVDELYSLNPAGISFDWQMPIEEMRVKAPGITVQGNLDPDLLFKDKATVIRETKHILEAMKNDPGFIFNLGHGVKPKTPMENVRALVDTVLSS